MPLGKTQKKISTFNAWFPYIFLALILIISRTYEPLTNFLKSVSFNFTSILNEEKISASFQILYLPGGILMMVCLVTFFLHKMSFVDSQLLRTVPLQSSPVSSNPVQCCPFLYNSVQSFLKISNAVQFCPNLSSPIKFCP